MFCPALLEFVGDAGLVAGVDVVGDVATEPCTFRHSVITSTVAPSITRAPQYFSVVFPFATFTTPKFSF